MMAGVVCDEGRCMVWCGVVWCVVWCGVVWCMALFTTFMQFFQGMKSSNKVWNHRGNRPESSDSLQCIRHLCRSKS